MDTRTRRSRRVYGDKSRSGRAGRLAAIGLFAIVWTGPAASAAPASQSPAQVKYYIVPPVGRGPATLSEIAAQTLGSASRFWQIYRLNKGRLQPNGRRLENPRLIEPGWVLELPPYAAGPGVHVGPLPGPRASATPSPRSPSQPAAALPSHSAAGSVIMGLALVAVAVLTAVGAKLVVPRRRRRRRSAGPGRNYRRDAAPRSVSAREVPVPPARAAKDQADWSWPSATVGAVEWPADHPSRPMPAVNDQGWPADHPSRPMPAVDAQGWPSYRPGPGGGVGSGQPVPAAAAAFAGPAPGHRGTARMPRHSRAWPMPSAPVRQQTAEPGAADVPDSADTRAADALRIVSLLLSEADAEAAKIRAEAAAAREHATERAAAVREAAERDAEELRASLQAMSGELSRVAALVTERLTIPGKPESEPQTAVDAPPDTAPAGEPAPASQPAPDRQPAPGRRPAPATKPGARPRQLRAARIMMAAVIGLFLVSSVTGATEILLHGFPFFVFRSAGTGGTPGNGLQEDQGPGQPRAPGAGHHPAPHHQTTTHHRPVKHASGNPH